MISKSALLLDLIIISLIFFIGFATCVDKSTSEVDEKSGNNINEGIWKILTEKERKLASEIKIKVYTGNSIATAEITDIPLLDTEKVYQHVDHAKPLVLYIHGYREHPSNESIRTIVEAHLKRGTDNIFVVDWSELAFNNFVKVVAISKNISPILARVVDALFKRGLDLEKFHLVGHSVGGQIVGLIGKYSNHSIPRITGLDPAFPGYYILVSKHIDAKCARFVDIIHTDSGLYGAISNTGTVDFYANGGTRPQPGCSLVGYPLSPRDLCSHWRSWRFYAETVNNEHAFQATKCSSYLFYKWGFCEKNQKNYVGYATPTDLRGSYYFQTKSESPFGNVE